MIKLILVLICCTAMVATSASGQEDSGQEGAVDETAATAKPQVRLETTMGEILVELDSEKAPLSAENFLTYVDEGFYEGTIFHRVIDGFMIQGGGFTSDMKKKDTNEPVLNEAKNGLSNVRGTLAMARMQNPHSATAQFFINLVDNTRLDHPSFDGWGYAVFGRVIQGMEVVDAISKVAKTRVGPHGDVPTEPVLIEKASRVEPSAEAPAEEAAEADAGAAE